ncbi:sphingomyelin phosphodiesterase 4, neutral membrane (neutral sphingomyelinase-3) [Entophlyctis sp. JEL0112]|nr:sphingomyelin phosphodiesterase 4, neutral membrane (neutral sphingomyelinase-3) [Entophlyctis sp. JEL0112]
MSAFQLASGDLSALLAQNAHAPPLAQLDAVLAWCVDAVAASTSEAASLPYSHMLHACLPTLCALLFGARNSPEYALVSNAFFSVVSSTGATGARLLTSLLAPKGPLMQLLLRADQHNLRFKVDADKLSIPLQKIVARGPDAANRLPLVYRNKINWTIAKPSVDSPSLTNNSYVADLRLNMLEFFIFNFAHSILAINPIVESQQMLSQSSISKPAVPLAGYLLGGSQHSHKDTRSSAALNSVRFSNLDDSYFVLLKAYLDFFVPTEGAEGQVALSVLNTPNLIHANGDARVAVSQFFIQILLDLWCSQNDYFEVTRNEGKYFRPSAIQIQCVRIIVQHIASLDYRLVSGHKQLGGGQKAPLILATDIARWQAVVVINAFEAMQKPLYHFLRLALKYLEADENFVAVVDTWIMFLTPWNQARKSFAQQKVEPGVVQTPDFAQWIPYIVENYLFYSRLLRNYMERAVTFDLFAAARPADLTKSSSASRYQQNLPQLPKQPSRSQILYSSIEAVFAVFTGLHGSEPNSRLGLLQVLRCIDAILVGCELPQDVGSRSTGSGSFSRTRTNSGGILSAVNVSVSVEWLEKIGGAESVASWVRSKIVELESRSDYQSVFMAGGDAGSGAIANLLDAPGIILARGLLGNIYSTIDRLNSYLPVDLLGVHASISTDESLGKGSNLPKQSNFEWTIPGVSLYIWTCVFYIFIRSRTALFGSTDDEEKEQQKRRVVLLQVAVARLGRLAGQCVRVFAIREEERAAIESGARGSALAGGDPDLVGSGSPFFGGIIDEGDEADAVHSEILPGVLTPDQEIAGKDYWYLVFLKEIHDPGEIGYPKE